MRRRFLTVSMSLIFIQPSAPTNRCSNRWQGEMNSSKQVYEVRPRKDKRGVDLISDALLFGALWYGEPDAVRNAIGYAEFRSRSHDAVIRVCRLCGS
jgi:hypothetical protein